MKKISIWAMTICCAMQLHLASAQSAELQQLALDIEKLAQFKQILSDLKKGYDIASKGYEDIKNLSQGNFNLHQAFLDGLLVVSPAVNNYKRVADIISGQAKLLSEYKKAFSQIRSSRLFTAGELNHLSTIYDNLLSKSLEDLDELSMILTSGRLRMSDDERIEAIDRLYGHMQNRLSLLRQLNKQAYAVQSDRKKNLDQNTLLRRLNGLP